MAVIGRFHHEQHRSGRRICSAGLPEANLDNKPAIATSTRLCLIHFQTLYRQLVCREGRESPWQTIHGRYEMLEENGR